MRLLTLLLLIISTQVFSQPLHWSSIPPQVDASFRGLSVVDDNVAWASGSKGWVGKSINGGSTWAFAQVKGFEKCDFRSLYAFNERSAIIANAGAPAYILRTDDAGTTWRVLYTNTDTAAFFDGIGFWNDKEGLVYGDPINGRITILRTIDGGNSWQEIPEQERPMLTAGEASFAASGTSIRCMPASKAVIATGGTVSRLLISGDKGESWHAVNTPIIQGKNSTGVFSVAFADDKKGIIVGGDYKIDTLASDHIFLTNDNGKHWIAPAAATRGYRECVEYVDSTTLIATGPSGSDISYDSGHNWKPFSDEKMYHVLRKSRKGSLIIAAGGGGKIAFIK